MLARLRTPVIAAVVALAVWALIRFAVTLPSENSPGLGAGELDQRPLPAVEIPVDAATASWKPLFVQADGSPVTWSPCRPIHWVYRPDHGPADAEGYVRNAVDQVELLTGLDFVYDGHTDEQVMSRRGPYQPDRYPGRWAPVLVAWGTTAEVPEFPKEASGLGGGTPVYRRDGTGELVSGVVLLDPYSVKNQLYAGWGSQTVMLHELGHLVGLAHVDDPNEAMYTLGGATSYGPGDLAGLAVMGSGSCHRGI